MVLTQSEDVQTDLFRLLRDGHHRLDPLRLGGLPAGGRVGRHVADGEDSELHHASANVHDTSCIPQPVEYRLGEFSQLSDLITAEAGEEEIADSADMAR